MSELVTFNKSPLQFTVAKLLLATTSIAILFGVGRLTDDSFGRDPGWLLKAYVALLTIYAWRSQTISHTISSRTKWLVQLTVFAICLPYLYHCFGPILDMPVAINFTKWIGLPVWVFAIPSASFLMFDLKNKWNSPKAFACRTMIELLLFFPWTFVWAIVWINLLDSFWFLRIPN